MKKILMLSLILLSACSCNEKENIIPEAKEQKPVVKTENSYSYQYNRNNCNTCTTSYTVRKPVEVIYENTTYTTVYEPKTYTTITHKRKPYNRCENSDLCY